MNGGPETHVSLCYSQIHKSSAELGTILLNVCVFEKSPRDDDDTSIQDYGFCCKTATCVLQPKMNGSPATVTAIRSSTANIYLPSIGMFDK